MVYLCGGNRFGGWLKRGVVFMCWVGGGWVLGDLFGGVFYIMIGSELKAGVFVIVHRSESERL